MLARLPSHRHGAAVCDHCGSARRLRIDGVPLRLPGIDQCNRDASRADPARRRCRLRQDGAAADAARSACARRPPDLPAARDRHRRPARGPARGTPSRRNSFRPERPPAGARGMPGAAAGAGLAAGRRGRRAVEPSARGAGGTCRLAPRRARQPADRRRRAAGAEGADRAADARRRRAAVRCDDPPGAAAAPGDQPLCCASPRSRPPPPRVVRIDGFGPAVHAQRGPAAQGQPAVHMHPQPKEPEHRSGRCRCGRLLLRPDPRPRERCGRDGRPRPAPCAVPTGIRDAPHGRQGAALRLSQRRLHRSRRPRLRDHSSGPVGRRRGAPRRGRPARPSIRSFRRAKPSAPIRRRAPISPPR